MCFVCNSLRDAECGSLHRESRDSMNYRYCKVAEDFNSSITEYKRPFCRKMVQKSMYIGSLLVEMKCQNDCVILSTVHIKFNEQFYVSVRVRNNMVIINRSCGWILHKSREEDLCYENKNEDREEVVCQCFEDGCNSSWMSHSNTYLMLILFALLFVLSSFQ